MTPRQEASLWLSIAVLLVGANLMGGGHAVGWFIGLAGLAGVWLTLHWMHREMDQ